MARVARRAAAPIRLDNCLHRRRVSNQGGIPLEIAHCVLRSIAYRMLYVMEHFDT